MADDRGIVPPYLDKRWQKLREHLDDAAGTAVLASSTSTTDEAKALIGRALASLMDASFWCAFIERDLCNDTLAGVDDEPDTDGR